MARFIPAPAGNTTAAESVWRFAPVHPRACGEHIGDLRSKCFHIGSSPRLRGTPNPGRERQPSYRFIPAPAGNTWLGRWMVTPCSVHPRACGEHHNPPMSSLPAAGSSPRLRGTHAHRTAGGALLRFIPAPAGNTASGNCAWRKSAVHPRACGEHTGARRQLCRPYGSSPRLRGTRQSFTRYQALNRFIPAPAGNTGTSRA